MPPTRMSDTIFDFSLNLIQDFLWTDFGDLTVDLLLAWNTSAIFASDKKDFRWASER